MKMDAKQFISKLDDRDPIPTLEKFLDEFESFNESDDFITDFLEESPNFEVILKLLEQEKWTKGELSTIFYFLGSCLMSLPTKSDPESVCFHVSKVVLQNHTKSLQNLLSAANTNRSVIAALKVVTGMIVHSEVTTAEVILQLGLDKIEFFALSKKEEVRVHLIYMVLAVLNNGDTGCLRYFLSIADRITCLFERLLHDPSEIVIRFLNLLRDIVLNINIAKTIKMKIFNSSSCRHLTALYFHPKNQNEISFNAKEMIKIKKALHDLMMPLCSNTKFGVIFREKENKASSGKINNNHVFRILSTIKYSWQLEEGRQLLSSTLKSCPDVEELFKIHVENHFIPRDNIGFFSFCKLFISIIESREPWKELEETLEKGGSVRGFTFTIPFRKRKAVVDTLEHSSPIVKHYGLLILISYFKKVLESIAVIDEKTYLSKEHRTLFKAKIMREIEKLDYGVNKLSLLWHKNLREDIHTQSKNEFSYQYCLWVDISHLLCIYSDLFGYKSVRHIISPLNMLLKVNNLSINDDAIECQLRINILKLILQGQKLNDFETFGFIKKKSENEEDININETLFVPLVDMYCKNCCLRSDDSSKDLKMELKTLCSLLLNSSLDCWGLSSYCKNYTQIWLDKVIANDQKVCSEFFAKVVSKSICNLFSYLDIMTAMNTEIEGDESSTPINVLDFVNQMDPSIQIEDKEDVNLRAIRIPFSCLILGALDVLKDNPDSALINYFMSVVDDYIHYLDHPEVLSRYILEKNILNEEMKEYLTFWSTKQLIAPSLSYKSDSNFTLISQELKAVFMGKDIPAVSVFCNDLPNFQDIESQEYICRQLYVYIHSEYKALKISGDKKKLKFYIKVFRKFLKQTQSNSDEFLSLFEHLLNHSFTLRNYEPFSSSDIVQKVLDMILNIVLEKYPSLHIHIKPFLDKFISSLKLKPLDEDQLCNSIVIYLDNYRILTFEEVERIAVALLPMEMVSENSINLLVKLFKVLKIHTSPCHQPSNDFTSLLISKLILIAKKRNLSEEELQVFSILSDYSQALHLSYVVQNLKLDDMKNILKSRIANATLIKILLATESSILVALIETLTDIKVHLECQIPFILSLIKRKEFEQRPEIRTYLLRIKGLLCDWAMNSNSEMNEDFQGIVEYMLGKELFEKKEVVAICNKFYKSKTETPRHILSLLPFFQYLEMKNNNNTADHDYLPPCVQIVSIIMRNVVKFYGKSKEEPEFLKNVGDVILNVLNKVEIKYMRKEFYSNKLWQSFVKKILKEALTDYENGAKLLNCLGQLCRQIYSKRKKEESSLSPKVLYQMLRSHSQFIMVMLNQEGNDVIKEHVALLQLTLVELSHEVCEERHLPLVLGAYGATMSKCDQYILKTLYLYEIKECMPTIEPTLWGGAAMTHFAGATGSNEEVKYCVPKVTQILPLIDYELVVETALNFNMELGLEPTTIVENMNSSMYDQRFLLSLFLHFTLEDHHVNVFNLVEKGMVAFGVAALSSHCEEVWAAGAKILQYVATTFDHSKFHNLKLQWMWLIGVVGYGLDNRRQRIPSIMAHFLIRASQLLLCPQDLMYNPVMNYLYIKPALSLFRIPELYEFFFSRNFQNNKEHREFILDLLAFGIKDDSDIRMCEASFVPKLLFAVIKSQTVNTHLRVLALKVLNSMVKIRCGAFSLVMEQSLLEELPHSLKPSSLCPSDKQRFWIEAVIEVLTSLWHTWKSFELNIESAGTNLIHSSGGKRKLDECSQNNPSSEFSPKKKRKLLSGEAENKKMLNGQYGVDGSVQSEKKKLINDNAEAGLVEIFRCIGCIFSQVMKEGTVESISYVFQLLSELITCLDTLEKESRYYKVPIIRSDFAKHQVKIWMETSDLAKRFQGRFIDEDLTSNSSDKWRFKPLLNESTRVNEDCGDFKTVIQKRRNLLDILNS